MSKPPPPKRARREAAFTTPPQSEAEREAEIANRVRRWAEEARQAGLTGMNRLALQEIMMQLTEEERVRFCRLDRSMVRFCRDAELYRQLTERDYPELRADWQKYSIVGGSSDANDGSWALYYRLLQRNFWCRIAVTTYWASINQRTAEIRMSNYERERGPKRLPIETHFLRLSFDTVRQDLTIRGTRYINDAEIIAACVELFGDTALPWSRFYFALRDFDFAARVIGVALGAHHRTRPNVLLEPIHGANFNLVNHYAQLAYRFASPRPEDLLNLEAAALILQPDGPLRRACTTYAQYTRELGRIYAELRKDFFWYRLVPIFARLRSYEEQPSNEWILQSITNSSGNPSWQELAYFVLVDFEIAVRTGDNRRLWLWLNPAGGVGSEMVAQAGPLLKEFIDSLRAGLSTDTIDFEALARRDFDYAIERAEADVDAMLTMLQAAADGDATVTQVEFSSLNETAFKFYTLAWQKSLVLEHFHLADAIATAQTRLDAVHFHRIQAAVDSELIIRH